MKPVELIYLSQEDIVSLKMLMGGKIAFKHASTISKLVREEMVDISKWVFPVGINDDKESVPT